MMKHARWFVAALLAGMLGGLPAPNVQAKGRSSSHKTSSPKEKKVHVKSYKKKDGTKVKEHNRRAPGEAKSE
jgi:hypothetical protein